jgi:hypothetical protein
MPPARSVTKTTDHLLALCPFTHEVWALLLARAGLQHLAPPRRLHTRRLVAERTHRGPGDFQARIRLSSPLGLLGDLEGTQLPNLQQHRQDDVTGVMRGRRRVG